MSNIKKELDIDEQKNWESLLNEDPDYHYWLEARHADFFAVQMDCESYDAWLRGEYDKIYR